ncbi:MAG: hypothetical protein KDE47_03545 [Caldilineaceae bacterium]|nr:hypothetical protein [Caldilineaceae bacterium]MCB9150660.1 hypothetical protein [Caldilineaceae bacterium]
MNENIVTDSLETQGSPVIMTSQAENAQPVLTTQPVTAQMAADTPAPKLRDDGVTLIAGYHFFWGILLLLGTCLLAIPTLITGIVGFVEDPDALVATGILFAIGSIVMVLCLLYLVVGYGLWTLRRWGRTAAIALGVISLVNVPIGTIVGGVTIWYLLKENVAQQFE